MPVEIGFRQPKLFTLIHQHRAAKRNEERERELRQHVIGLPAAPARHGPHNVMVRECHAGKKIGERRQQLFVIGAENRRLKAPVLQKIERIAGMQSFHAARIQAEHFRPLGELTEGELGIIFIHRRAHALHRPFVFGPVRVMDMLLQPRRMRPVHECAAFHRQRRVVGERRIVQIGVRDIEAETVHAPVEPETQHIHAGIDNIFVVEVELRLALQKFVMIILPPDRVP